MKNNISLNNIDEILNFGLQPRCFDYISNTNNNLKLFDFALHQSIKTGLLQLKNPLSADLLVPKFSWVKNKEPDDHAYIIADEVLRLSKFNESTVLFLSHFDNKVYDIVKEILGSRAVMLDSKKDLSITKKNPSQALIQEKLKDVKSTNLKNYFGKFDIIVNCRLLEHVNDFSSFVNTITKLLKKDGKIIFEVPDSTKSLLQGDIAMLWEEHTYYFTPESLRLELKSYGYSLDKYIVYNYPQEDALIGIFTNYSNDSNIETSQSSMPFGEYAIANIFKKKVEYLKSELSFQLSILRDKFGEIIIFGAGHRATMFINLLGISDLVSLVIDDDPNKNSLKIPLAGIEIKSSEEINWNNIGVCIFAISLNAEEKVKKVLEKKIKNKIKFYSISPDSQYSLPIFSVF